MSIYSQTSDFHFGTQTYGAKGLVILKNIAKNAIDRAIHQGKRKIFFVFHISHGGEFGLCLPFLEFWGLASGGKTMVKNDTTYTILVVPYESAASASAGRNKARKKKGD